MTNLKQHAKTFILALAAGMCIGIGGVVYLSVASKVAGAFLFAVGLLSILVFKLNLYTGMLGYTLDNKPSYLLTLLFVWLGNFFGTSIVALLMRCTRVSDRLVSAAKAVVRAKLDDNIFSLFILGIFCGILMFIAVDTFKKNAEGKDALSALVVVLGVMVFILAGFEHSIADMFYFVLAGELLPAILPLIAISLGNFVGGNLIPAIKKAVSALE